jgi:hypothetical protein
MVDKIDYGAIKYCFENKKSIGEYERMQIVATGITIDEAQKRFDSKIPKEAEVITDHGYRLIGIIQLPHTERDMWQEYGFALIKKK